MFESWGDMMCSEAEAENDRLAEEEAEIERQHKEFCEQASEMLASGESAEWLQNALYEGDDDYQSAITDMVLHLCAGRVEDALAMKDKVCKEAHWAVVQALWRKHKYGND